MMTQKNISKKKLLNDMRVKNNNKIAKVCTNCFEPIYLKFNFSYIVYDDNFSKEHQLKFLNRIRDLSSATYNVILNRDKKVSFEFPDMDEIHINKEIPKDFQDRFDKKRYNNKWAIMRIYPNNNPINARVIGVMINKIFYIFFIDIGGNLYKHD